MSRQIPYRRRIKRKEIPVFKEELVTRRGVIFRTCFAERCKIDEGILPPASIITLLCVPRREEWNLIPFPALYQRRCN